MLACLLRQLPDPNNQSLHPKAVHDFCLCQVEQLTKVLTPQDFIAAESGNDPSGLNNKIQATFWWCAGKAAK